jgi:hypothetical protein
MTTEPNTHATDGEGAEWRQLEALCDWAEEIGFLVEDVPVDLDDGRTRPGFLVLDMSDNTFMTAAVNMTRVEEVREYILESSLGLGYLDTLTERLGDIIGPDGPASAGDTDGSSDPGTS